MLAGYTTPFCPLQIAKLAAIRIKGLCEKMNLHQQTVECVYSLVQHIINHHTALFFNRHVDQIILCSIYGVAKVCLNHWTLKICR
jgi:retinoblastoma-like protein 1